MQGLTVGPGDAVLRTLDDRLLKFPGYLWRWPLEVRPLAGWSCTTLILPSYRQPLQTKTDWLNPTVEQLPAAETTSKAIRRR